MGHEMHYGFQSSPFLELILSHKHSVPTLKALSLKRTKFQIFRQAAACRLGNNTPADIAKHSVDRNQHVPVIDVPTWVC
jgi:hypothetical protein